MYLFILHTVFFGLHCLMQASECPFAIEKNFSFATDSVEYVAFSTQEDQVAIFHKGNTLDVYKKHNDSWEKDWICEGDGKISIHALDFHPKKKELAVLQERENKLKEVVIMCPEEALIKSVIIYNPSSISYNHDGSFLAISGEDVHKKKGVFLYNTNIFGYPVSFWLIDSYMQRNALTIKKVNFLFNSLNYLSVAAKSDDRDIFIKLKKEEQDIVPVGMHSEFESKNHMIMTSMTAGSLYALNKDTGNTITLYDSAEEKNETIQISDKQRVIKRLLFIDDSLKNILCIYAKSQENSFDLLYINKNEKSLNHLELEKDFASRFILSCQGNYLAQVSPSQQGFILYKVQKK